nr:uncharacterized protein LOC115269624 [Aedes albopictus]
MSEMPRRPISIRTQSGEKVEDAVAEDFFELAQLPARSTGNVEQEESDGSDEESDKSDGGPDEDSDEEVFRGFDDESCENLVRGFDDPADQSVYEDASGSEESCRDEDIIPIQEESNHFQEEQLTGTPRRSARSTKGIPPERYMADGRLAKCQQDEPRSYQEATYLATACN